ncbi:ABC1 atypical kinase-like domain [Dillenia turbinata]|uniref:ABC1 atypical kinase-like domain n=1 Tax=Dillenia turbinata TaxID=194707 RepID=A0AAN8V3H0_9MAGN
MATSSLSASSIFPFSDLSFLRLQTAASHKIRVSLSKFHTRNLSCSSFRILAVQEEATTVGEGERESDLLSLNGNGNGSYIYNGSVVSDGYTNEVSNGSLVKYVNGNGSSAASVVVEVEEMEVVMEEEKKSVEEIGQEEAWFKRAGQDRVQMEMNVHIVCKAGVSWSLCGCFSTANVQVSVAPGGRWSRFKTYSTIQRTLEIWGFVLKFIFQAWLNSQKFAYRGYLDDPRGMTEEKKVLRRKELAKWLKENILRLGPTFIKIGQQFSTRVDILPQEYVDQLSELQDQVPPFPSETALSIVEEELGASVSDVFYRFDFEPIAAASLGQVHRARLKGQEVVVKVQRPGLKDLFDIDLKNLRVIAEYLQKFDPKSDGAKRDWVAIYDECASVLYQEIDYTKEAANAEQFADNFKAMEYVKVPKIFWDYTTPQVLTMELGRYAVESYLEQILSHGFFHADPHPGNIAVDDVNGGRLIFYDFGMMGSISPNIREGLLEAFYGVYEKDPDRVLQAMIQTGVLVPTGDMTAVRRTAQFFLNSFEEHLTAQRREREMATAELGFKKLPSKEERIEKKKQRLVAIGEDLLAIAADQPFRFPATFTFVVRAFSVLDGIGKGLDPRFDITEIAKPYALELLRFREAGVEDVWKRWDQLSQAFYNLFRQADRVEKLAAIIQRLEQGDLKLRVRTLESERAFQRVAAVQKTIGNDIQFLAHCLCSLLALVLTDSYAVAAGSLVNLATILYLNSIRLPATAAFVCCTFFSFQVLFGIFKVKKLDQQEKLITGTA